MNRLYSAEGVEKAEHLYCFSGHSLRGVAELTGASLTTLKRWSEKNGWGEKKSEIGGALIEIRTNTVLLRKRIIELVSIQYHKDRSGSKMVPFRYHASSIHAPSRQRKRTCGLNAGAGLRLQQARLLKFFRIEAV